MPPDRHPIATPSRESSAPRDRLRAAWPLGASVSDRGYRPTDLAGTELLAALLLDEAHAVAVVGRSSGPPTALPCTLDAGGWRIAKAGDGVARALLASEPEALMRDALGFQRYSPAPLPVGAERALGTDQSNISVVVGDAAIVKWRSAPDADGRRATQLRRHLQANGFTHAPALLASLSWTDGQGRRWAMADVDAYLPDAEDGWEYAARTLRSSIEGGGGPGDDGLASTFGWLTASLHAALAKPSRVVSRTVRAATPTEMDSMREAGLSLLARAAAIEAPEQRAVLRREPRLREAIGELPSDTTPLGLIHGDLHVGQLVAWRNGLAIIDFDGAPEPTEPAGALGSPARDVAQSICSLWSLAAVVHTRTGEIDEAGVTSWATSAEAAFLGAYRQEIGRQGLDTLDDRLLEPLIAEQFARELLYAEAKLPRWRYAPLQALCWRYPLDG